MVFRQTLNLIIICCVFQLQEFRLKMGSMLPRVPRNNPPQGRTEFENLTDLLRYVSEDRSAKNVPPQAGE
jgi:hypothetical protein